MFFEPKKTTKTKKFGNPEAPKTPPRFAPDLRSVEPTRCAGDWSPSGWRNSVPAPWDVGFAGSFPFVMLLAHSPFCSKVWVHLLRCLVLRISWLQLGVWTLIRNWSNTTDTEFVTCDLLFCPPFSKGPLNQPRISLASFFQSSFKVTALKLYPPVKLTAKTSENLVVSLYTHYIP